jgi:hypothetical protein
VESPQPPSQIPVAQAAQAPQLSTWRSICQWCVSPSAIGVGKWLFSSALMLLATLYFSTKLQEFSGSALWLPVEWRSTVRVVVAVLGLAAFQFTLVGREKTYKKIAASEDEARNIENERRAEERANLVLAMKWAGITIGMVTIYIGLRYWCVAGFDPASWLRDNKLLADKYPVPPDTAAGEHDAAHGETGAHELKTSEFQSTVSTSQGSVTRTVRQTSETTPADEPVTLPHVANRPDYVLIQGGNGRVYLPAIFDPTMRRYMRQISADQRVHDPVQWVLNNAPNELFDWEASGSGAILLGATTCVFLFVHDRSPGAR